MDYHARNFLMFIPLTTREPTSFTATFSGISPSEKAIVPFRIEVMNVVGNRRAVTSSLASVMLVKLEIRMTMRVIDSLVQKKQKKKVLYPVFVYKLEICFVFILRDVYILLSD